MRMPQLWEIVSKFKDLCRHKGWKTSKSEDWVAVGNDYHNFLFTRQVTPYSFKRIASSNKCVIHKGLSYNVVETSYVAWLFSEAPSADVIKAVSEDPDFSSKIAIYDLSQMQGRNLCARLNSTDSMVFRAFESFLKSELKVKLRPFAFTPEASVDVDSCTVAELA